MRPPAPYADVRVVDDRTFSIPELKWRELLFVGAIRRQGEGYTRNAERPLPAFEREGLFPEGALLEVVPDGKGRVLITRKEGESHPARV